MTYTFNKIHRRWNSTACANCPRKWWEHSLDEKESSGECQWWLAPQNEGDHICLKRLPCRDHNFGLWNYNPKPPKRDNEFEELRRERGWPTPNHMRKAADALDMLVYPKYGDILRWVADQCDGKE